MALEKISELLDFSFFRYLEYKYSQYIMLLAKLLLCMNIWLLHFVVVYNHMCNNNVMNIIKRTMPKRIVAPGTTTGIDALPSLLCFLFFLLS